MADQIACPHCGVVSPAGARFCAGCGRPVAPAAINYGPEEEPPPTPPYQAPPAKRRGLLSTGCAFGSLAAGIVLLAGAAVVLYLAMNGGGTVTLNWPPVTATPAAAPTSTPAATPTVGPAGSYGPVAFGSGWDGTAKVLTGKANSFDQGITTLCAAFSYKGLATGMHYHWDVYLNGRVFYGEDRIVEAGGEGIASPCVVRGDKAALSAGIYTLVVKVEDMEMFRASTTIRAKP